MTGFIVDTDIGSDIDDALALLLLLHLPDVEVLGVTTVYGCADLRAKIARKIVEARGVDIPVFAGCGLPLSPRPPIWLTGTEGWGVLCPDDAEAPLSDSSIDTDAEDFIIDTVMARPGEVLILALGPLTNIAKAIQREPRVAESVKAIYFMGGGVTYPRALPDDLQPGRRYHAAPSHNVWCDLRAARCVFESNARMFVVTNDVTTRIWWDGPAVAQLVSAQSPDETAVVGRLLGVHLAHRSRLQCMTVTGICPHDVVAAAEASGKGFVSYVQGTMEVMCDRATEFTLGPDGRHFAAVGVDGEGFLRWLAPLLLARP